MKTIFRKEIKKLKKYANEIIDDLEYNQKKSLESKFNFIKVCDLGSNRQADYYLSCLDSSVYIDFNKDYRNKIYLKRISFDGYGCCELNKSYKLNSKDSNLFFEEINKKILNQDIIEYLVKKIINMNLEFLWEDALLEYNLI